MVPRGTICPARGARSPGGDARPSGSAKTLERQRPLSLKVYWARASVAFAGHTTNAPRRVIRSPIMLRSDHHFARELTRLLKAVAPSHRLVYDEMERLLEKGSLGFEDCFLEMFGQYHEQLLLALADKIARGEVEPETWHQFGAPTLASRKLC